MPVCHGSALALIITRADHLLGSRWPRAAIAVLARVGAV